MIVIAITFGNDNNPVINVEPVLGPSLDFNKPDNSMYIALF